MKTFRQKFVAAGGLEAKMPQPQTAAAPAPPKPSRRQRRFSATQNRHINEQIKKANELGRPISLRQNGKGVLEVVIGKAKKKVDPNPQPGEVISSVEGNAMPPLPEGLDVSMSTHVHDASCEHAEPEIVVNDEMKAELDRIAKMDLFEAADELVESVVGR
jgi:hypothetical protein